MQFGNHMYDLEEEAITNLEVEKLNQAIATLSVEEAEIIRQLYAKSRWLNWLSAFLMGEICNIPPIISNFITLQRFIIRDKQSVCLFVSFFIGKKLNTTNITNISWKITITARDPPYLSETGKQIKNRKEETDETKLF